MSTDIESRLAQLFEAKAAAIAEDDLSPRTLADPPLSSLVDRSPRLRVRPSFAVAAVLLAVVGALTVMAGRDRSGDGQHRPPATSDVTSTPSTLRAWPLTGDRPLPGGARAEDLATPDAAARAYLTDVVGHENWPLAEVSVSGAVAVARYVLQDVPAEIGLAQAAEGSWYVTGATSDLLRPAAPVVTSKGLDLPVEPGPRTYETGSPVRVAALAADGRVLATRTVRVQPAAGGDAAAASVASLGWDGRELAAAVRADVLDDHDGDPATPDVVIGHWTTGLAPPAAAGLPAAFDLATAEPVFAATGSLDAVADAYLRARFPDYPAPGITEEPGRTRSGLGFVTWSTGSNGERHSTGLLVLRQLEGGWAVLAAATAGVDLSDVRIEDGRLRGRVRSTNINSLFADVLRADGAPVAASPRPDGYGGSAYRFGSAAGPANGTLEVDVPIDEPSAILRVNLVGGTILSVSEVRIPATNP